jgi:hypothetical protein
MKPNYEYRTGMGGRVSREQAELDTQNLRMRRDGSMTTSLLKKIMNNRRKRHAEGIQIPSQNGEGSTNIHVSANVRARNPNWKLKAGLVGAAAIAAVAGYLYITQSTQFSAKEKGKVVRIVPRDIEVGGEIDSCVTAPVHENNTSLWAKALNTMVPFIGRHIVNSTEATATFTGYDGEGCGMVDTWIGAKAKGISVKNNTSTGGQNVDIPARNIVLFSRPDGNNSSVIYSDGILHSAAYADIKEVPGSGALQHEFQVAQAQLDQTAQNTAVNYAQDSCVREAWGEAQKALTVGYRAIYEEDYQIEKAFDPNIHAYNPDDVHVQIQGIPDFPDAYSFPGSEHYKITDQQMCTIGRHALQIQYNQL